MCSWRQAALLVAFSPRQARLLVATNHGGGIDVQSTCWTQVHRRLPSAGPDPECARDCTQPGMRSGWLRHLGMSVVRSAVPAPSLSTAVPPLHGRPAAHLHQVRLSAAGVQSLRPAALGLLPTVLAAVAVPARLVALSVPDAGGRGCPGATRLDGATCPDSPGCRQSAGAAQARRAAGIVRANGQRVNGVGTAGINPAARCSYDEPPGLSRRFSLPPRSLC